MRVELEGLRGRHDAEDGLDGLDDAGHGSDGVRELFLDRVAESRRGGRESAEGSTYPHITEPTALRSTPTIMITGKCPS